MSSYGKKSVNRQTEIDEIFDDPIKYGITISIQTFGSLNLKRLSQLIGKPESTTFRHVKFLLDKEIIDLDAIKTKNEWGTYYKLAPDIKRMFDLSSKEDRERQEETAKVFGKFKEMTSNELNEAFLDLLVERKDIASVTKDFKRTLDFYHIMQNAIVQVFDKSIREFLKMVDKDGLEKIKKQVKLPPTDIALFTHDLPVWKLQHLVKYYDIVIQYLMSMDELKIELKKEAKKEQIPENEIYTQHFHLFTGSTDLSSYFEKNQ